jgi:hypothetical protein
VKTYLDPALADMRASAYFGSQSVKGALQRAADPKMHWILDTTRLEPARRQTKMVSDRLANLWNVQGMPDDLNFNSLRTQMGDLAETHEVSFTSLFRSSQKVTVRPSALYKKPPQDLRSLVPVTFEGSRSRSDVGKSWGGAYDRNYRFGSSQAWDAAAYSPMLPEASKENVGDLLRTLSESTGGLMASAPMVGFSL